MPPASGYGALPLGHHTSLPVPSPHRPLQPAGIHHTASPNGRKHIKDQCRRIVEKYNARLTATRADKRLSEAGRKADIAADHEKTKAQLAEIKHAAAEQGESRQTVLQRRMFGIKPGQSGGDVIAYRDAVDRVGKAKTAADLAQLMTTASEVGDNVMLRAAAGRAQRLGGGLGGEPYRNLAHAYIAEEGSQAVSDLEEYTRLTSSASKTQAMVEAMGTSISRPKELDDRHVADDTDPGFQPGDYHTAAGIVRGNG
jgi:hypothetical protein